MSDEPYNPFVDQAVLRIKEREAREKAAGVTLVPKEHRGFVRRLVRRSQQIREPGLRVQWRNRERVGCPD